MKKYPYLTLITLVVIVLSLMPVPEMPHLEFRFIDKWTHLVMYFGVTSAFWLDYCRLCGLKLFKKSSPFFHPRDLRREQIETQHCIKYALLYPIALGGILELLQQYCTGGMRSGDWIDWIADAVGALIGYGFCDGLVRCFFPRR